MKRISKKIKVTALVIALAVSSLALVGCGGSKSADSKVTKIKVGANITPHSELLEEAKKTLKKENIDLEVVKIEDAVTPNTGVTEGTLDANFFQHQPYLDDYNKENKTDLVSIGAVHYEPFAVYSSKIEDLSDLKKGAKIAVPNNVTNEARALLLLEQEGVLELKEGADIAATKEDIKSNPKNIKFVEIDPSQLVKALPDVDAAVINGNYAIEGGLSIKDALAVEADTGIAAKTYANIVVTDEAHKNNKALKKLVKVLQSDSIKKFIESKYEGAVVPIN